MRRFALLALGLTLAVSTTAFAAPNFTDDFETGVNSPPWFAWPPGAPGQNLLIGSTDHSLSGTMSAKQPVADPAGWNAYADFGATTGQVDVSVWQYEDNLHDNNTTFPVAGYLALYGTSGSGPQAFTDYDYLGVLPAGGPVTNPNNYYIRTAIGDTFIDTGVARKAGWTQFKIAADAGVTGQVRFYIDGALVGTSTRNGVGSQFIRLGSNSKNYETFYYDNVRVVPEPSSVILCGLGIVSLIGYGIRRRAA